MHMKRKWIISSVLALTLSVPALGQAQISSEMRSEVRGYAQEYKEHAEPVVRVAAILTLGQTATRQERREIEAFKTSDNERVRLAAGMALLLAGERSGAAFAAQQLKDSTTLYVTLRDVVSLVPAAQQRLILAEVLKGASPEVRRDVFRYLSEHRGEPFSILAGPLVDTNDEVRAQAIQALVATGRLDALGFAEAMMAHRSEAVRLDGLRLINTLRTRTAATTQAVELLEKALGDRAAAVKLEAARQLVFMRNAKGTEVIVAALAGAEENARRTMVQTLLDNEVRPSLAPIEALIASTQDKEDKALLYELAASSREEAIFETLKKMFYSENFDERIIAVRALGRTKNAGAGELLGKGLFEGQTEIRLHSARGLGHLADEASLPLLRRAVTQERVKEIRLAAIDAVGQHKSPAALQILRFLATDNDVDVKRHLVRALRSVGLPEGTQTLDVLARDRNTDVQWLAFLTVLELNPEQGLRQAPGALRNPPDSFAIDLDLHRYNAQTRLALFERLLTHESPRVRSTALQQIGLLGDEVYPALRKALLDGGTPGEVRTAIVYILTSAADEADKPLFERLVRQDAANDIGQRAAWALTRYADPSLEASFRGYLAMDNPTIRAIATFGLAGMK